MKGATMDRLNWILAKCEEPSKPLTEWEHGFISGIQARQERRGDHITLTDKEWIKLEEIAGKVA